jgi:quercetin dioxygenase-like cupin family protein
MYVTSVDDTEPVRTGHGNSLWVLLPEEVGVPNFVLRYFEVPPEGATGYGKHAYEHEVFVVRGEGILRGRDPEGLPFEHALRPGDAVFIAPNEEHQFCNPNGERIGFVCVVPRGCE